MDAYRTDSKSKTTESIDDLAMKFINVRPLKCERNPANALDPTLRSMKSIKKKNSIKC